MYMGTLAFNGLETGFNLLYDDAVENAFAAVYLYNRAGLSIFRVNNVLVIIKSFNLLLKLTINLDKKNNLLALLKV